MLLVFLTTWGKAHRVKFEWLGPVFWQIVCGCYGCANHGVGWYFMAADLTGSPTRARQNSYDYSLGFDVHCRLTYLKQSLNVLFVVVVD